MTTKFDVLTIGNAIVDVIATVEDTFLADEGMDKAIMHLIDEPRAENLFEKMPATKSLSSGGSAANTAAGIASFGGTAAFVGKVKNDDLGHAFASDFHKLGIHYDTPMLEEGASTARCMIFVTEDGERTMNTYLGACQNLTEDDIKEDQIGSAGITYMEGYLWDPPEAKKAFVKAAHYAHKNERAAAITLSDPFCVNRYREEFLDLIKSKTVDYVFANADELKALYEADFQTAVQKMAEDAEAAAITLGEDGAMAIYQGEIVSVPAHKVGKVVDVTGAGDLFASGFLLGVSRGFEMNQALDLGCMAASEVISHVGARPLADLKDMAGQQGLKL